MTSASIDHIGIGVPDLAAAKEFSVPTRTVVEQAHQWAVGRGCEVVHAPRAFPEYGEHTYATYVLDPHGIMLEVACHAPDGATGGADENTVRSGG